MDDRYIVTFDGGQKLRCFPVTSPYDKELGVKKFPGKIAGSAGLIFLYDWLHFPMFWNKGVAHDVDVIYVGNMAVNTIFTLKANESTVVVPLSPSNQVIELAGGQASKLGIVVGSTIADIEVPA